MKVSSLPVRLTLGLVLSAGVASASASILFVTGNDTLVGNRAANLITNGSFEADAGMATNYSYWATGTSFTPIMSLSGWAASGQVASYAIWGSNGSGGIMSSATFPHGTNGLYFGGGIMAGVSPLPTEANNGLVTFASTPTITPKPTDGPVTLQQTVSGLNPSATYLLDFWTSGEQAGLPAGFLVDGFFGLDISGEPRRYFAAPSGTNGPIGTSQRYQVYFTPTAPTLTFEWINWGHYTDPTNGFSDELVLDDVILNLVSNVPTPIDCNCVTNITVTCPGVVPDLCALFAPCFTTNMMPGSCTQNFPPGMQFVVGTYPLTLQVMDMQSNIFNCTVQFDVLPQVPAPPLTVVCPTNKTVECGSGWSFDSPVILSSCCGATVLSSDAVLSQAACSEVIERVWTITDGCGNQTICTQKVTTVDTTPPGRQCGMNLVPNPSFENYTNCPGTISMFDYASPWFTPSDGTTDLYSPCAGPSSFVSVPTNGVGVQTPLSGQAYAGAAVWSVYGLNTNNTYRDYREYLEVPLLAQLVGGQRYQVSFYVSRADHYRFAVAEIGAAFSKLPLQTNGYYRNFNVVPQVENSLTNLLTSTNGWLLVQGTFIANGSENYLTIGNFRTDANTTWTNANPGAPLPDYAYYYFDDISVTMLCDPITNKVVECSQPWEWDFNPQLAFDNCSGDSTTLNTTTTTSGYCPTVITRDWELTDACGNSNFITQTITNIDTTPPMLQCAPGANLVPNPQFENKAYCPFFFSQVTDAAPWFNPTIATPDYMNTCATFPFMGVPNNAMGNQAAFSGDGYMGAFAYSVYGTNPVPGYREYIEAPLLAPLQPGMQYQVSFYVSLADSSGWAIGNIGAHLSAGPLTNGSTQGPLTAVPQVANPPGNLLTNKTGWTLIQGTFTATGGENHITLGNFLSDALTTAVTNASGTNHAYYYYDDISVVPLCSFTNKTAFCGEVWDFDPPLAYDECSGDYLSIFVTSTTVSGTCPKVHTRVWTIYDACANSMTATQSVTELDATPPVLLCSGVNLIPNPGFENFTQCANGPSWLEYAKPWYLPTVGSSDLFNPCASLGSGVSVPVNLFGSQTPFAGLGYGGGYVYFPGGAGTNSSREYLSTPLIAPLIAGQSYAVSFRVNRADNMAWAIAEIGAHFSAGPVTNWPSSYLPVIPQVENPSANIITSTTNWTLISGVFTAIGGEDHITLGNFRTDANTTALYIGGTYNSGYYYYDEVSVVALCTNVPVKDIACGLPWTFDAPVGVDGCSGSNVAVTVASTVTNGVCSKVATRTWTLADPCGNTNSWSQTVTFLDNIPLTIDCNCLSNSALALLATNACAGIVPDLCQFTNCFSGNCGSLACAQSPVAGSNVGPGTNLITVTVTDCTGGSAVCVLPFVVNPPATSLSLVCASNKTVQCGSAWDFDKPTAVTTCCDQKVSITLVGAVTNGSCPKIVTGTFQAVDVCGNTATCTQTVTIADTAPPTTMCSGVSLVPNGNFESYGICPDAAPLFSTVAPWYPPTLGSPDYFNACGGNDPSSVPTNVMGVQAALSGQAYVGIIVYYPDANTLAGSYREYIQTPLLAPLIAGQSYLVSFHVSLADTDAYAIADIGAHLSVGPVLDYTMQEGLAVVPQVVNPSSNSLTSSNSWMLVQGVFTAGGGEDHLTLGSFVSNAGTTAVPAGGTENYTYYYIDDVSIVALCPPQVTNQTVACGAPWTFDPPVGLDACSGSNVTVTFAGSVTNTLCPLSVSRVWTLTDQCGNTNSWTQTISVTNAAPLVVNCACLQDSVLDLLATNACAGIVPDLSVLGNSPCISNPCGALVITQSPAAGTPVGPGVHNITLNISNCSGPTNECVLSFFVNAPSPVITCPSNRVVYTCYAGVAVNFTVSASGNTGPIVCTPPSGSVFPLGTNLVTCVATNSCGGIATCQFHVIVRPGLNIIPANLPTAVLFGGYAQTLTASEGVAPYTFEVAEGSLPPGLALASDGALTGTAEYPGRFGFAVSAIDRNGCFGIIRYTLAVAGTGNQLVILTNGVGSLKATRSRYGTPTNNAALMPGTNYLITAIAPSNHVFSNWVAVAEGGINYPGSDPKLSFTFQSNLVLIATFTTNQFYDAAGSYHGLFWDTNNGVAYPSAGFARLKVAARSGKPGRFSGNLSLAGEKLPITGEFDAAGEGVNTKPVTFKHNTNVLAMQVQLSFDDGSLSGVVSNTDGSWVSHLSANRAEGTANYAGQYTMILPGSTNPAASPGGAGHGLVTITTNGRARLTGALGDGAAISQTVPVSGSGDWPLYAVAHKDATKVSQGLLMGWMTLTNGLEGTLYLIKQPLPGTTYPEGFTNEFVPLTSPYAMPATGSRVIELTGGSNGVVVLTGGNLATDITNLVNLSTLNKFKAAATNTAGGTNKLALSVAVKTGKLTGSFKPDGVTSQKIAGAVLQQDDTGAGYFKAATNTGSFRLQAH